jgi:phosphoadenosine phosphosulfate reductase
VNSRLQEAEVRFQQGLERYRRAGKSLFASSSFQTHSLPLLHLLSRFSPETPVYFLDTGFHFPETLAFRETIARQMGLDVRDLRSPVSKLGQRDASGQLLFASDPDHCCYLNKTLPMESVLLQYDVWISGLRRDQNNHRKALSEEAPGPHQTLRWHAMLEWDAPLIWAYRQHYQLPEHPLEAQGYLSVGCEPCTERYLDSLGLAEGEGRSGRWAGLKKTECGLHTDLILPA